MRRLRTLRSQLREDKIWFPTTSFRKGSPQPEWKSRVFRKRIVSAQYTCAMVKILGLYSHKRGWSSINQSITQSINQINQPNQSTNQSINSINHSIYPIYPILSDPIYLSIFLSIYLSIYLSVCLSINHTPSHPIHLINLSISSISSRILYYWKTNHKI